MRSEAFGDGAGQQPHVGATPGFFFDRALWFPGLGAMNLCQKTGWSFPMCHELVGDSSGAEQGKTCFNKPVRDSRAVLGPKERAALEGSPDLLGAPCFTLSLFGGFIGVRGNSSESQKFLGKAWARGEIVAAE